MKRRIRLAALVLIDVSTLAGSLLLSLVIRFDGAVPSGFWERAVEVLPFYVVGGVAAYHFLGLYRGLWRYASLQEAGRIGVAVLLATSWLAFLLYAPGSSGFPRSVILITTMMASLGTGASRVSVRVARGVRANREPSGNAGRTLIVGAGDAGVMLLRELLKHGTRPVGFIDDDPLKLGRRIQGVQVLGTRQELKSLIERFRVNDVVIAMPSASRRVIGEVYEEARKIPNVSIRTVPTLYDIAKGKVSIGQPRPVDATDLLGREPVRINMDEVAGYLRERRVMVTGAGGSIGAELCRQVAAFAPTILVLLDHDENGIFDIQNELRSRYPGVALISVIADIRDRSKMERVFEEEMPEVVFHAAAHKHVPFMEENPEEAVKTNVFGTENVAKAALACGADRFVLISTDKAVNPSSVMGASKRVAEHVVQNLNGEGQTRFMAVRFGNVLASRGSVVPLFQTQISEGGPVTLTDPDMTRFFMTIPEAVQLVMQAAALGKGGEVFVLDMGEPVKILDLARTLIRLNGLEPDRDIEIIITGRRPGEKLFEEVLTAEEGTEATTYDRIFSARVSPPNQGMLRHQLQQLEEVTLGRDRSQVVEKLVQLVPTFEPEATRRQRKIPATGALSEVAASTQGS